MRYANFKVKVKKATHSYSENATFRRETISNFKRLVGKQSASSKAKHCEFTSLVDWWHSLPDVPGPSTFANGSKEYWHNGPKTFKYLKFWQDADAARLREPEDKPMPKADREVLFEVRQHAVYQDIEIILENYVEPAPHKYNPASAAAARAGSSEVAVVLGSASVFKRKAVVTSKPRVNRMTAAGQMQRGAASAPQPKWEARPVADSSLELSAAPASRPRSSSWSDAHRNWYEASTACSQSGWWTSAPWKNTTQDDAEITEHHGDNDEPWSSSAEPRVL